MTKCKKFKEELNVLINDIGLTIKVLIIVNLTSK